MLLYFDGEEFGLQSYGYMNLNNTPRMRPITNIIIPAGDVCNDEKV